VGAPRGPDSDIQGRVSCHPARTARRDEGTAQHLAWALSLRCGERGNRCERLQGRGGRQPQKRGAAVCYWTCNPGRNGKDVMRPAHCHGLGLELVHGNRRAGHERSGRPAQVSVLGMSISRATGETARSPGETAQRWSTASDC